MKVLTRIVTIEGTIIERTANGQWTTVEYGGGKRYTFSFNEGLAKALKHLYEAKRPIKTKDCAKSLAQYTNFSKLNYWKLATPHVNEESIRKAGWWEITNKGKLYVERRLAIPKFCDTQNKRVILFHGPEVYIDDILPGYDYRQDYREQQ